MRLAVGVIGLCCLASCGGKGSTGGPSPTPTPTPTYSVSGRITDAATGAGVSGATATVIDGPNVSRSGTTDGTGTYTVSNLTAGGFTMRARAQYYNEFSKPVTLTANQALDFALAPIPPWSASGIGDTVLDMPTTVQRVKITADYTQRTSNFVVWIGSDLVVNTLVGIDWNQPHFEGTYLTTGGVVQIQLSSGVRWSFTEVR